MTKTVKIKVLLLILPIISFAFTATAFEMNDPTLEYDSMYRYNALENKVDFSKMDNYILPTDNDTLFFIEEDTTNEDNIKKLEDITIKQNRSIEISNEVMNSIQDRSGVRSFLLGNGLGVLKFQLVQMKDQSRTLNTLLSNTDDNSIVNQINSQIDALGQQRAKVDNFILEHEDGFSLFGWLVSSL